MRGERPRVIARADTVGSRAPYDARHGHGRGEPRMGSHRRAGQRPDGLTVLPDH